MTRSFSALSLSRSKRVFFGANQSSAHKEPSGWPPHKRLRHKIHWYAMFVISTCSAIINSPGLGPERSSLATCTTCTRRRLEIHLFDHQPSVLGGLGAASGPHSAETLVGQSAEPSVQDWGSSYPQLSPHYVLRGWNSKINAARPSKRWFYLFIYF